MEKHNLESTIKTYLTKLNTETSRALTAEVKKKKKKNVRARVREREKWRERERVGGQVGKFYLCTSILKN